MNVNVNEESGWMGNVVEMLHRGWSVTRLCEVGDMRWWE